MISGFVIFMSLNKINSAVDFAINRFCRLYPTYWASVTFTYLLATVYVAVNKNTSFTPIKLSDYIGNMTMFQFYLRIPDIDGPYWTMIIEMLFYIVMLIIYKRKLLASVNIIGLSISAFTVILNFLEGDTIAVIRIMWWFPLLQFAPLFFAGTLFYSIYINKKGTPKNYFLVSIYFISQVLLYNYAGRSKLFITQTEYAIILFLYFGFFTLFVNNKLGFIVSRGTLFFGKISYALYLTHQFVSTIVIIPFLTSKLNINYWIASFFVALPVCILTASFITYYIEIPLGKFFKTKLRRLFSIPHERAITNK
jgi:peptidoglycan/LPS O-acetylase OafA/YrhL